jgi:hypothetical protein
LREECLQSWFNKLFDAMEDTLTLLMDDVKQHIQQCVSDNESNTQGDILWRIVERIITEFKKLDLTKENEPNISPKAVAHIKTLMEFIVMFGIAPRLLHGVGLSPEQRIMTTKNKQLLETIIKTSNRTEEDKLQRIEFEKLLMCVDCLLGLCRTKNIDSFYQNVIYQNYLMDVLATLIQICYAPLKQSKYEVVNQMQINEFASPATLLIRKPAKELGLDEQQRKVSLSHITFLIKTVSESQLVSNLMQLISTDMHAPTWFKQRCGNFLSRVMLRKRGVFAVMITMLENVNESKLRTYERVVNLILTKPSQCKTQEEYLEIICPQLITLLHLKSSHSTQEYYSHVQRGTMLCIGEIITKYRTEAEKHLLRPILDPLYQLIENKVETVNESVFATCIEDIHKLVSNNAPTSALYNALTPVIPTLFQLFCYVSRTKLYLKHACEEIITSYFRLSDDGLTVLKQLLTYDKRKQEWCLVFYPGETGSVGVKRVPNEERDYLWEAQCMINLLKLMKNDTVAGDLFMHLMTQFTVVKVQNREENEKLQEQLGVGNEYEVQQDTMLLLQVIKLVTEEMGPSIMKNTQQAITFAKFLLLCNEEEPPEEDEEHETIGMALGLISAILAGAVPILPKDEPLLEDLQPILQKIIDTHPSPQIQEMATSANLSISSKQYRFGQTTPTESPQDQIRARLQTILNDLKDPLLPIRAHGIMSLRKLVLDHSQDALIKDQIYKILDIFRSNLKDDDTYVYLGAVQGLCALADVYPSDIIPLLTKSFHEQSKLSVEDKLKTGESLVTIARRCGEMLPHYAHFFVNCFLHVAQQESNDELVRASALSNLSTIMGLLKYAIHPYLIDILETSSILLERKTSSRQIKSACLHVFSNMVRSMGKDLVGLFGGNESQDNKLLSQLVTLLRKVEFYDQDEMIKLDARNVLEDIDTAMKQRLFPEIWTPSGDRDKSHLLDFVNFMNQ